MKAALVDTNILSLFFKGHPQVVDKFETYLEEYETINLSIITYYEIVSGLKHRDAHKQIDLFLNFVAQNTILPLTQDVADIAAEIYAQVRKSGQPIDDIDLLIAATAVANGLTLVTHNQKHFQRIVQLEVENWVEKGSQ
ncbi:MAG: type II toxin-antitoxin system VapC family toxin [Anaerolineales bacterium]|nr:type II toxin-antitoxin system VapC family toxin [Anaerolineales bacterium]